MNMNRRQWIQSMGMFAAGLTCSNILSDSIMAKQITHHKNILFIAVDDLRPQLGCYGHKQMISPNIDALARRGALMERAYCQVPVCGASRASLLSGLYPTQKRFVDFAARKDADAPQVDSLPAWFNKHGYTTVQIGKVYHHADDDAQSWSEQVPTTINWLRDYHDPTHLKLIAELEARAGDKPKRVRGPAYDAGDAPIEAYLDGKVLTDSQLKLQKLAAGSHPFFLAVGFHKPHLPFNCPKQFWDLYDRRTINLADNPFRPQGAPDSALHNWSELRSYHGIPAKGPLDEDTARTLIHGYYACTSFTDYLVGELLKSLDQTGQRDNTIICLWGDHGWNLGEHGLWCKHANFETSLHSPLLLDGPGIRPGTRVEGLCEFIDVYPTLCDLAGVPSPSHLQGKSLSSAIAQPNHYFKEAVFSRYYQGESIKTDRYRYTAWYNSHREIVSDMLYDHLLDHGENINVASIREYHEVRLRLQSILMQHIRASSTQA